MVYQLSLAPFANQTNASSVGFQPYSALLTDLLDDPFQMCVDPESRQLFVASHLDNSVNGILLNVEGGQV
jgi:hypothetical protein